MNHTSIVNNLARQVERRKKLAYLGHPFVLGELNSIAGEGITGGIQRLHFHQGTDYRYASWQPIKTEAMPIATRPPYYGQIMVASALGRSEDTRIVNIPLLEDTESAYAIYHGDELTKLVVLNMQAFNQTCGDNSRPTREYKFQVPGNARRAKVERLIAPGSDSIDHVTFSGVSYDYDLKEGKPVNVDPATEIRRIRNGVLGIDLPDSSAVLLTLV
ncbi:hypothetical protein PHISP_05402 [Aspergillus sp. HF37]|nr:hypothetical protein PHISP_05402 [Aspergillus sp. HF37]